MTAPEPRFFNRELSWLEFNQRVLEEARDPEIPLLERLKFLAITASNLDEFFMVRVGGLQILREKGNNKPDPAGLTPEMQLQAIGARTSEMQREQYECFLQELEPGLAAAGIRRLTSAQLSDKQATLVRRVFEDEIYPVFTPMAIEPEAAFPLLVNQTLNLCVRLAPRGEDDAPRFAIIPFGRSARRFLTLQSEGGYAFILLEDAVIQHVE
jgi:polyphosphate kinase